MTLLRLAFRNLVGGGLKTWLRVSVLSLAFVVIVTIQGLIRGMDLQASQAMVDADIGGGQYWHERYDAQDPLTLADAHGEPPARLAALIARGAATPVLAVQGFMYASGSFRPVLLKGIDPGQHVLTVPSAALAESGGEAPALIGNRMAREAGLKPGDVVTVRWRDAKGTFDAQDVRIVEVMTTTVQNVDSGQLWLPLDRLRRMARMEGEATWIVLARDTPPIEGVSGWTFKDADFLLSDVRAMVRMKSVSNGIVYLMLLFLAMLAILDTQVLSIFHRRKEIGTLMALGLTRGSIIRMFTLEGALNAVLAALVGALYGIPLLAYIVRIGIPMPAAADSFGVSLGERLYPAYGAGLVAGTTFLVLAATTIVSYLPTRRIARLQPTDALRGRLT
jgi:ABC-type lipoprotein release transport system permease subunit